jgi:hypothetical protein
VSAATRANCCSDFVSRDRITIAVFRHDDDGRQDDHGRFEIGVDLDFSGGLMFPQRIDDTIDMRP